MRLLLALLVWSVRAALRSRGSLALENFALRQQLATYARGHKRPRLKPEERVFWVALSRVWSEWRSPLAFVKPATVIAWHRRGFQRYWRWRSRMPGRPRIPDEHIALIRRISSDQPGWGEDRIAPRTGYQAWREALTLAPFAGTWCDRAGRGAVRPGGRSSRTMRPRSLRPTS